MGVEPLPTNDVTHAFKGGKQINRQAGTCGINGSACRFGAALPDGSSAFCALANRLLVIDGLQAASMSTEEVCAAS